MIQENIVSLKNTVNPDYQKKIHETSKEILKDQKEISVDELRKNSVFQNLVKNSEPTLQISLWAKIKSIAGDMVDKTELKTILVLLDAKLEKVEGSEKFVSDNKYELNPQSGIFQATRDEVGAILKTMPLFDFDDERITMFPKVVSDTKVEFYDRNNQKVDEYQE